MEWKILLIEREIVVSRINRKYQLIRCFIIGAAVWRILRIAIEIILVAAREYSNDNCKIYDLFFMDALFCLKLLFKAQLDTGHIRCHLGVI